MSEYELPLQVHDIPSRIKQISAGARHTIILDNIGDLWLSGRVHMQSETLSTFKKLELNYKFQYVSCGWDVIAAISTDNRLFVWGNNSSNQLGVSKKKLIEKPEELLLPDNETPIEVKFGLKFIAILTSLRNLYITGNLKPFLKTQINLFSLITHNSVEWLRTDNKNASNGDILYFACGQSHISFVRRDGLVIHGHGENKFGQCAQIKSGERIKKIESGWTHVAYLTDSKKLYLYGRNCYGQLGNGNRNEIDPDTPHQYLIFPVEDFALGAEHGILKSNDSIYTWGWNEHRNCGTDSDEDM